MAQYEITLRDYWRILRRRRSVVGFTAVLLGAFSLGLAVLWQPRPLYRSAAKVQISTNQTLTSLYLQSISYNAGDQLETQRAIITSFPVLRQAGERLGLFTGRDTAQVVLDLQSRIVTRQEGYTNIVVVEVTGPEAELARDLANTVAQVYQEYDDELKNQQAVRNRRFVEEQREKARGSLERAEEAVRQYRQESELVSLDAQAGVMLGQITEGEREVASLEGARRDLEAMLQEMERAGALSEQSMQGASKNQVGDTFMSLVQQLNQLRLERDGLLVQFTEGHPKVQQLQAKIDQLGRSMAEELRQRRLALIRDQGVAATRMEELRRGYHELPTRGLDLARLQREVTLHQEVVTALEEEYQRALIREADRAEGVTVLQWAVTSTKPINPTDPVKRAGVGVVLGLILGVVFAVVAEVLDTSMGTIEDVQEYTGTQVVGIVPFIRVEEVADSLRRRGERDLSPRVIQRKAQLVAYFDPQSTLAEAFRTLRTNIEFVTVEKGARTLMVTSSTSQEGKSTVSANLAMTMAQLGKRTLLVDCDLRKPTLARLFGLEREPGLAEVIVGNFTWSDVLRTVTDIVTGGMGLEDVMQTQGISNLHIVTSGAIPPNPAELLNSRRMDQFIAEVAAAYDVVLLDAPPVLHVTDAAILGKKTDGALMVYRAGDVPRTSLRRAVNLLRSVDVALLGVVLNGVRAEVSADYYDFGYSSYYAYGNESRERKRGIVGRMAAWFGGRSGGRSDESAEEGSAGFEMPQYDQEDDLDELGDLDPALGKGEPRRGRWAGRLAAGLLLILVAAGVVWQSGYLPISFPGRLLGRGGKAADEAAAVPEAEPVAPGQALRLPDTDLAVAVDTGGPAARIDEPLPAAEDSALAALPGPSTATSTAAVATSADTPAVAAPSPAPATGSVPAPALAYRGEALPFSVQVAAYAPGSARARQLLAVLRQRGEPAFLTPGQLGGRSLVRLLIGSFPSAAAATAHGTGLRAAGVIPEFLVLRLPYAVEVAVAADEAAARAVLTGLGVSGRFACLQVGADGVSRVLAGAFSGEERARSFGEGLDSGRSAGPVVQR
ncbi:MAG: P-loop NTPase [Candidatus Latescibacterota bacterium]|jgi:Mrp family chromosome partitioning ATPase/uncharacterized protein involved in exopolysaccharide biosynthesis/cell division septation protein DedD